MRYWTAHLKSTFVSLAIPKELSNIFLSNLWDTFNSEIGGVGSVSRYRPTSNPKVYEYYIHWADSSLSFEAELIFKNHTSRGLLGVEYAAMNRESKEQDKLAEGKIHASLECTIRMDLKKVETPTSYMCVPFITYRKIIGSYKLSQSKCLILKATEEEGGSGRIIFPVYSKNKVDAQYEGLDRAIKICSVLSTLTQNLFTVDGESQQYNLSVDEFAKVWGDHKSCEKYADDSGFLKKRENPLTFKNSEIIEEGDCILEGHLALPAQVDSVVAIALRSVVFLQSCSRFAEALYLRRLVIAEKLRLQMGSYEIIAYTASIEALLDTAKKTVEITCPNCSEVLCKEEWKISDKYKNFVLGLSDDDYLYKKYFKPLYEDRSKFVHTGSNVYDFYATRPGRPMVLAGKKMQATMPEYYWNIHELTGWLIRKYLYIQSRHAIEMSQ